ncbi:hypothetical protein WICMUC_000778 [Wickerhamomyces mucosus]|uniref:Phosphate metabolism protein 7 n=1 Tax=Wickerhamomyces mucosus TaxID=1378264 RepID=A0A9P8PY60_9ASCO|nr:hypothetical protein WICMUC_000778 [Wickerhamomyces mucosus]
MADAESTGSSTSAFVSALILYGIIGSIIFFAFTLLRPKQPSVYEPKTLNLATVKPNQRPPSVPKGPYQWFVYILSQPQAFFIQYIGVDGYLFTRYLGIFTGIGLLGCLILLPILLPVNATNGQDLPGFDLLSFANVTNNKRYYAHVFLSWIYFGLIIYVIFKELIFYVSFRHSIQTTPLYDGLLSSRTLLLTDIPVEYLTQDRLEETFPSLVRIWYSKDHQELSKLIKERSKLAGKYEGALNKVINKGVKFHNKLVKKGDKLPDSVKGYITKQPTHRLGKIPLLGKKVETIDYSIGKIDELNGQIQNLQDSNAISNAKQTGSVFIEFHNQLEAQRAYQAIPYLSFKQRIIGVAPNDIVWDNLPKSHNEKKLRTILANTFLTLLIIFWAIPVAVVGCISNINFLTEKIHFLRFINNCPKVILGLITGILPTVALAILMSLVPVFIKKAGSIAGLVTKQQIEQYCQSWYFGFQVIQVFLVVTLASSASSTVTAIINDPSSAMTLLAQNLPKASNFYIAYFLLQGLMTPALSLLRIVPLLLSHALAFLQNTPRKKWNKENILSAPSWGVIYPPIELLIVLFIVYSIIAPIILIFSTFALGLLYVAFLYLMTYINGNDFDSRGRNYPKALFQTFVGLYLAEVCNLGLFIMAKTWGPVALSVIILVVTVLAHLWFRYRFEPLLDTVPISVIRESRGEGSAYSTYIKDQGLKEIKQVGKNYSNEGSDQNNDGKFSNTGEAITLADDNHTVESPTSGNPFEKESNVLDENLSKKATANQQPETSNDGIQSNKSLNQKDVDTEKNLDNIQAQFKESPTQVIKRFFNPLHAYNFTFVRSRLPTIFNDTVTYTQDYLDTAYHDPAISDERPHIWIPSDPLGISDYEIGLTEHTSVLVSNENTEYNKKGDKYVVTGEPPSYEEAVRA